MRSRVKYLIPYQDSDTKADTNEMYPIIIFFQTSQSSSSCRNSDLRVSLQIGHDTTWASSPGGRITYCACKSASCLAFSAAAEALAFKGPDPYPSACPFSFQSPEISCIQSWHIHLNQWNNTTIVLFYTHLNPRFPMNQFQLCPRPIFWLALWFCLKCISRWLSIVFFPSFVSGTWKSNPALFTLRA